ncbi:hypothetical protein P175DRAFT_0179077 [Aspergillus ochraceoroseus IBT 24754]|uniref:AflI n=2 Tax=Aspergillus ochraceoroseus TaxID=138278 RepID=B5DCJ7_9EURO|nr:uncharacterized protein P175DRAFT_0179077 [Aspergillus ochraceoroseus IBT 24754]ACH72897.1 AflI [Aspergillus ochraceoroseus]KKK22280.1 hypothetical protein AOCH_000140 [Aspergillus ochraceoroseus]PTU23636.1 hypothetical protein P175DRAFT_0179077 [Aspergillus ochraceoroseus IBT 24754]
MPTYALLGATGATGSSVLRHLLRNQSDSLSINILVRSKTRLLQTFPDLRTTRNPAICIFQGSSTDPEILGQCLRDASVVFICVGQNGSPMGTTLSQDTASAIIDALRRRRQAEEGSQHRPCTIIQLRSASLNPALAAQVPRFVHRIVRFCLFASYADLERACAYYSEAQRQTLLEYILVDPPTLHDTTGTHPTGYRLISTEPQAPALSYADLGVALCEIAQRRGELHGQAVGVTATGRVNQTWGVLAKYLLDGGMHHANHKFGKENILVVVTCFALLIACLVSYM